MAADTKRGATKPQLVCVNDDDVSAYWFDLDDVKRSLAAKGLHVVTAAEKAVLDAMAEVSNEDLEYWVSDDYYCPASCEKPGAAELARREAVKSSGR